MEQVEKVREYLTNNNLDALLVSDKADQYYLANFTGDDGFVVIDSKNIYVVTDARFFEQIKVESPNSTIVNIVQTPLADFISNSYKGIAIESDSLLAADYQTIVDTGIKIESANLLVKKLRMHKSPEEIALIKKAAEITDKVYDHIVKFIKIGMTEKEVANEIEYFGKKLGAQALSFETIVASGIRSSYPHGNATDKKIDEGDVVTLDFGFVYKNYFSDITRTVAMGSIDSEMKKVYEAVLSAEEAGMKFAPMVETFGDLDRVVRGHIEDSGYGEYFNHGTGHGLGLVCHDYPTIRRSNNDQLESNIVFTVEPGIYLPGKAGVRIEDDMYVNDKGESVRLTNSTNELIIIK
ncbi:M24 family metallopeptidase [Companilactobacillus mishanensis]|uniref:M24 family metallopeptidase n=1 Tax=Companilactobacillus mishanensis TaxID=2486008 RepID=UPI001294B672|nr:aminopeptidase P family protein [Companilactobacillus mishanensis]